MELLNKIKNNKKGFTLVEAITATALVAIAASMSVGVFAANAKVSQKQYEINNGQNYTMSSAEKNLSSGGATSEGTAFEMIPADGSAGFGSLENGGKVEARYQEHIATNGSEVQYKVFKYDVSESTEGATVSDDVE